MLSSKDYAILSVQPPAVNEGTKLHGASAVRDPVAAVAAAPDCKKMGGVLNIHRFWFLISLRVFLGRFWYWFPVSGNDMIAPCALFIGLQRLVTCPDAMSTSQAYFCAKRYRCPRNSAVTHCFLCDSHAGVGFLREVHDRTLHCGRVCAPHAEDPSDATHAGTQARSVL